MYLIFAGVSYYPSGGAHDLKGHRPADQCAEAREYARGLVDGGGQDWAHVAQIRDNGETFIVFSTSRSYGEFTFTPE